MAPSTQHVLLVDDDILTLKTLSIILEKNGYKITTANSGQSAIEILQQSPTRHFLCLMTDFRMPGMTGLELIHWLKVYDPTLSTIILTGETDRNVAAGALREGAADYLQKPFRFAEVVEAIQRCAKRTQNLRSVDSTVEQVKEITLLNEHLNHAPSEPLKTDGNLRWMPHVITRVHPIKETGGDFVNSYLLGNNQLLMLVGDVSGHDLKAGFISAYFQGMVRGLVDTTNDVGAICERFNTHLVKDWNAPASNPNIRALRTSLAASFLLFDFGTGKVSIHNHGLPIPIAYTSIKEVHRLGEGGPPLGWFDPLENSDTSWNFESTGGCYMWCDGLEDYAVLLGINEVTLAYLLIKEDEAETREELLSNRPDDILVVYINWNSAVPEDQNNPPLDELIFFECYPGNSESDIDKHQKHFHQSLRMAFPTVRKERLDEITLCLREGLINGLKHGCKRQAHLESEVHVYHNIVNNVLHVMVKDPGPGFMKQNKRKSDDEDEDIRSPFDDPEHVSLGQQIINSYADLLQYHQNGAIMEMRFQI